jgi:hypothetical protein
LRCENTPQGARNLQECSRHTETHIPQLGFTGIHRDLELGTKGGNGLLYWWHEQREERGEDKDTHQRSTSTGITRGSPEHGRITDRRRGVDRR